MGNEFVTCCTSDDTQVSSFKNVDKFEQTKLSNSKRNILMSMVTTRTFDKNDFIIKKVIGRGSFGKVYMVE